MFTDSKPFHLKTPALDPYLLFLAGALALMSHRQRQVQKWRELVISMYAAPIAQARNSLHPLRHSPPWHSSLASPHIPLHSYSLNWVSPGQTLAIVCLLFCLIRPPALRPILHSAAGVTASEHRYAHRCTVLIPSMTMR